MNTNSLGEEGERIAENFLKKKGYRILERNYIPKNLWPQRGEIDIIAENKGRIIFVEVKSSFRGKFISPEMRVNFSKAKKIKKVAETYLMEKGINSQNWQMDVISVTKEDKKISVKHFENVFSWRDTF